MATGKVTASYLVPISKSTAGTATTITFTRNSSAANRYTGLLFVTTNTGASAIYALNYKATIANSVEKLSGRNDAPTPTIDTDNGNVSVALPTWSNAVLITSDSGVMFT